MATLEENINACVCDLLHLAPDSFKPDSRLVEDLGADSLDLVSMAVIIEDDYEIVITDEELTEFKTVQDVINHVRGKKEPIQKGN